MSRYVIEIEEKPLCVFDKDTHTYFPRLWRVKGFNSLVLDEEGLSRLEELNSDYINEHFGELQDAAYQRGLDDGKKAFDLLDAERDSEYQRGLSEGNEIGYKDGVKDGQNEAWEAARKIVCDQKLDWNTLLYLFNKSNFVGIFGDFSASEAIAKLKAYEEKQKADDEIKVGDEVISLKANGEVLEDMSPWIVTYETKYSYQGFEACGMFHKNSKDSVRKTGRHFDIEAILREMANEDN